MPECETCAFFYIDEDGDEITNTLASWAHTMKNVPTIKTQTSTRSFAIRHKCTVAMRDKCERSFAKLINSVRLAYTC